MNERGVYGPFLKTASFAVVLGLAGCSADITRLQGLGLNDGPTSTGSVTSRSASSLGDAASDDGSYRAPSGSRRYAAAPADDRRYTPPAYQPPYREAARPASPSYEVTPYRSPANEAPAYQSPAYQPPGYQPTGNQPSAAYRPAAVAPRLEPRAEPSRESAQRSGTITVQSGDTLFRLARRHNTSVAALKAANNLQSSILRVGQSLVLPGAGATPRPATIEPRLTPIARAEREPAATGGDGTYIVRPGDSIYKISRNTGVRVTDLMRINGITDARRLMPGTELRLQGGSEALASREPPRSSTKVTSKVTQISEPREGVTKFGTPRLEPRNSGAASDRASSDRADSNRDGPVVSDAEPEASAPERGTRLAAAPRLEPVKPIKTPSIAMPAPSRRLLNGSGARADANSGAEPVPASLPTDEAATPGKFRWPVRGRIITGFGPRKDGTHNDGIDISVAMGSEVHAAESGVVAYAGNELQGYGNLVLIRHDNGWVSAYAHNDKLLVERGVIVTRGQVIARAGKSGGVGQPQVHFELREGAKPVDPLKHLEKQ